VKRQRRAEPHPLWLAPAPGSIPPEHEHDACGIGFVANIEGRKSHDIVLKASIWSTSPTAGLRLRSPDGDGAGILIQIPTPFFEREARPRVSLPSRVSTVGMVFSSVDTQDRFLCEGILERLPARRAQRFGWRDTPTRQFDGRLARTRSHTRQISSRADRG